MKKILDKTLYIVSSAKIYDMSAKSNILYYVDFKKLSYLVLMNSIKLYLIEYYKRLFIFQIKRFD